MMPLTRLVFDAVHELTVGSLFCMALLPFSRIRRGFFQSCALILASAVGLEVWVSPTPVSILLLLLLLLYGASLWVPSDRWSPLVLKLGVVVGAAVVLVPVLTASQVRSLSLETAALIVDAMTSSLLLGSALIGMLLGHSYLRDPDLPVAPIRRLGNLFLLATVAQGLFLAVKIGGLYLFAGPEAAARIGVLSTSYGAVLLGRLIVGILGSFVFACLIWDTLRIPNVQAATGFFYVAILTVMIGEFLGRYLWHSTSIRF
ncbi:MAG: hypothetical protein ACREIN_04485 [Candidatus Methylomirabilaceae bacterium]